MCQSYAIHANALPLTLTAFYPWTTTGHQMIDSGIVTGYASFSQVWYATCRE